MGNHVTIIFRTGPKAGKAQVILGAKKVTVDTYAKKARTLTKTFAVSGTAVHAVRVKVLGAKRPASKGKTVSLALLQVKR